MGCCQGNIETNSKQLIINDIASKKQDSLQEYYCDVIDLSQLKQPASNKESQVQIQQQQQEQLKHEKHQQQEKHEKPKQQPEETKIEDFKGETENQLLQSIVTSSQNKQQQPKVTWNIKQDIFVRLNSSKNVHDIYQIQEMLGQGGFGKVYKVKHKSTGMIRALKTISKDKLKQEEQQKLFQETDIMIQMDHPNIVKLYEVFTDDATYYLVFQHCEGGELFEKIRRFSELSEATIAGYFKQILSAVMYCHKKGIVHRDLKPENILFDSKKDESTIQIIDFGASANLQSPQDKLKRRIGTPFYVAPEVLLANYNEKCDIWSIGVMLYILLCGYPPFFAQNEKEVLAKVKKGVYTFDPQDWSKVSMPARDLIRRMLLYEPSQRISAGEAFNHPWIQNNNVKSQLGKNVLTNLSDFQLKNKLKHAIFEFISVQVMTSNEKEELRKNFEELDKNGDGMVSKDELFRAYKKLYGGDKIKAQKIVDDIFNDIDANGSGIVDFSEFVAAAINKEKLLSRQKIKQAFKLFDLDGNGLITKGEIQELFGGGDIDEKMWNEILKDCDNNGDGMVNN